MSNKSFSKQIDSADNLHSREAEIPKKRSWAISRRGFILSASLFAALGSISAVISLMSKSYQFRSTDAYVGSAGAAIVAQRARTRLDLKKLYDSILYIWSAEGQLIAELRSSGSISDPFVCKSGRVLYVERKIEGGKNYYRIKSARISSSEIKVDVIVEVSTPIVLDALGNISVKSIEDPLELRESNGKIIVYKSGYRRESIHISSLVNHGIVVHETDSQNSFRQLSFEGFGYVCDVGGNKLIGTGRLKEEYLAELQKMPELNSSDLKEPGVYYVFSRLAAGVDVQPYQHDMSSIPNIRDYILGYSEVNGSFPMISLLRANKNASNELDLINLLLIDFESGSILYDLQVPITGECGKLSYFRKNDGAESFAFIVFPNESKDETAFEIWSLAMPEGRLSKTQLSTSRNDKTIVWEDLV